MYLFGIGGDCQGESRTPRHKSQTRIKFGQSLYECVSLEEAKSHIGLHPAMTEDDVLVSSLIKATARACEKFSDRKFMQTPFTQTQSAVINGAIQISTQADLLTVDAVEYLNTSIATTWTPWNAANYRVVDHPAELISLIQSWPVVLQPHGLRIRGTVGYAVSPTDENDADFEDDLAAARDAVEDDIRTSVKMWTAYLYEHRQAESEAAQIPTDAQELIKVMPPAVYNLMVNYTSVGFVGV